MSQPLILEPVLYLTGPAQDDVYKESLLDINSLMCTSAGKATGCSYFPPQYAMIGWGLPTVCIVGRCNEPGVSHPSYHVFVRETGVVLTARGGAATI